MPRDVNGNYTLPSAVNPVVTLTSISSVWANTTMSDVATAVTNSLDRSGASAGMTGQFKATDGAIGAPGISFGSEVTSGWYRAGASDIRLSIAGVDILKFSGTVQLPQGAIRTVDGLIGTPSYAWVNETNTGFYRNGAGDIRYAVAGVDVFKIAAGLLSALAFTPYGATVPANGIYSAGANQLNFATASTLRLTIDANGQLVVATPAAANVGIIVNAAGATEGVRFVAPAGNNAYASFYGNNANSGQIGASGGAGGIITGSAAGDICIRSQNGAIRFSNNGGTGSQAVLLGNTNVNALQSVDDGGTLQVLGWRDMPQVQIAANYTTVLSDRGKHIFHNSGAAHTVTIDSNANVAYPVGTVLTFINISGGGVLTIAITADSLVWMPSGTTGSRTLAAPGIASAVKVAGTIWQINGVNLS